MKTRRVQISGLLLTQLEICLLLNLFSFSPVWAATGPCLLQSQLQDTKIWRAIDKFVNDTLPDIGNEGSHQTTLTFDCDTGDLRADIAVTAKHNWGTLWNPFTWKNVDVAAGPVTLSAYFIYNLTVHDVIDSVVELHFGMLEKVIPGWKTFGKSIGTVRFPVGDIINLIEGDLDVSELINRIPNPAPELIQPHRVNNYDDVNRQYRDRYGDYNYYLASKSFVDWANPGERGFSWGTQLVLTGGAASAQIMKEVATEARKEMERMIKWLEAKGEHQAGTLIEMLLSGGRFTWPHLALVWHPIRYEAWETLLGWETPKRVVHHPAFVLVWDWGASKSIDELLQEVVNDFYIDLANSISQQLGIEVPTPEELQALQEKFIEYGVKYAETIFMQAIQQIYQDLDGSRTSPTPREMAEALDDFKNGLSVSEVQARIESRVRARRAVLVLLNQYMASGF